MARKIGLFIYNVVLAPFPGRRVFSSVKCAFLRLCGMTIEKGVNVGHYVRFFGEGRFEIGEGTSLSPFVMLEAQSIGSTVCVGKHSEINSMSLISAGRSARVVIGDYCHIAHNVSIKTSTHEVDARHDGGSIAGRCVYRDISIGSGSWVCAGAIILPGISIGNYNVVAAGAVVIANSGDSVLLAGVPAAEKKQYSK